MDRFEPVRRCLEFSRKAASQKLLAGLISCVILAFLGCGGDSVSLYDKDGDGFLVGEDCDDTNPDIGPRYLDSDRDGHGVGDPLDGCDLLDSPYFSELGDDCDDTSEMIYPGAEDVCDGLDANCDGLGDEADYATFYPDDDGDGFGAEGGAGEFCGMPAGYVTIAGDCDDGRETVNPDQVEQCDGLDNDCDGKEDEGLGITWYRDQDEDGSGTYDITSTDCTQPDGFVATGGDCDDSDPLTYPSAQELCDSLDNDCDGSVDEGLGQAYFPDQDEDGFGGGGSGDTSCTSIEGYVTNNLDCDDQDPAINPDAEEFCDQVDNNCDGQVDEGLAITFYPDVDGDTYGDSSAPTPLCVAQDGYLLDNSDCDDSDPAINPEGIETCNGLDDDCDGMQDEDFDTDGDGIAGCTGDCDDDNALVYPGATELCDGIDNNCNDSVDEDQYEPNDSLDDAYYLGDLNGIYDTVTFELQAIIASEGDTTDFYRFLVTDDSYLPEEFHVKVTLSDIPADADYDLFLWWDDPDSSGDIEIVESSIQYGNVEEQVNEWGIAGIDNGGTYWVEIRKYEGFSCEQPYTVVIENQG